MHHHHPPTEITQTYKKVLGIALALNLTMFFVELIMGIKSGSTSLMADAADFLGDSLNYATTIFVIGAASVWSSRLAYLKGALMAIFGTAIILKVLWNIYHNIQPEVYIMGVVAIFALLANLISAIVLYRFREGNANMRSVWLCTRNDLIGNLMIIIAAFLIVFFHAPWPDYIVGFLMGLLALLSSREIIKMAKGELEHHH